MNENQGLKYLLIFHRIFGISYCGYNISDIKIKLLSIIWNLLLLFITICVAFHNEVMDRLNNKFDKYSTKSTEIKIIGDITTGFHLLLCLLFISTLFFRGKQILNSIINSNIKLNSNINEKRVGIDVTLFNAVLLITNWSFLLLLFHLKYGTKAKNYFIGEYVLHPFIFGSLSSPIALIAYKSKLIAYYLDNMCKTRSAILLKVYENVCEIDKHIKEVDSQLSPLLFIIIAINILLQIQSICFLSLDFTRSYSHSIPILILSLSLLTALCYVCEIIPKSLEESYDYLKYLTANNSLQNESMNENSKIINILNLLNNEMNKICFTAFKMHRIRLSSILLFESIVISYSVVIIQTSYIDK